MVTRGELLSVVKISSLDASLVPKVHPDDLEDYGPYDFVRVQFQLPVSMQPKEAADDVKLLLSPNAKVQPLLASKRLLVIDVVANLRSVRDLLYAEQMAEVSNIQPRFYKIKHRKADLVADQIMIVLGLDPSTRNSPKNPRMDPKQMQMMMQMQQKGKDIASLMKGGPPKVFVAVDRQNNTILVNAPEQEFLKIERTIKFLDVGDGETPQAGPEPFSMERYKTVTASTDSVIKALNDFGNLDPLTQLQGDKGSKTIFAYAPRHDHAVILKMIGSLDGSGRTAEVIWLPSNLPADQVAGSIQALIGTQEEEDEDDDAPWYYFRSRRDEDEKPKSAFRVFPDLENNRLLLWASKDELEQVNNLIGKLKRNPDGSFGDNRTVRRFRAQDPAVMRQMLEQLKEVWPGENQLQIDDEALKHLESQEPNEQEEVNPEDDQVTARWQASQAKFRLAQTVVQKSGEEGGTNEPPPVKITVNSQGELIVASEDTRALDQLQSLLDSLAPSEPEFHYFKLRYIDAYDVVQNLEEYFEDALPEEGDSIRDWYGRRVETKPDPGPLTLGRRRPLRFIYDDIWTNTVIVANASPSQLKTIKQIIERYDQPPKKDDFLPRKTEVVQVKYSTANDIAASLRDVYRDLLSSKDKEFQDKDGKTSGFGVTRPYVFPEIEKIRIENQSPMVIRFGGVLSVGVDQVSNSVIVCAREELVQSVVETIKKLDEAAKPKTVVVTHEVNGTLSAARLQRALSRALASPWPGGKPRQPGQAQAGNRQESGQQESKQPQNQGRRGRR